MFRSIAYLLRYFIFIMYVLVPYYIFPIGYIYYYIIYVDKDDFLSNLLFMITFIYLYPLFCHTIPYRNYVFQ